MNGFDRRLCRVVHFFGYCNDLKNMQSMILSCSKTFLKLSLTQNVRNCTFTEAYCCIVCVCIIMGNYHK